jgi:hypothetical protein
MVGGKTPEKRISSNFLTVQVKAATEQSEPFFYPKRPAPLVKLGLAATGMKWGIDYHEEWVKNLPCLLSEIKDCTPFTDLAFFIFRDTELKKESGNYIEVLSEFLKERFTKEVSTFLIERIEKEKLLARHITEPYSDLHKAFCQLDNQKNHELLDLRKEDLVDYIGRLETLLKERDIKFDHLQ